MNFQDVESMNVTAWPALRMNFWGVTKCANTTVKNHLLSLSRDAYLENPIEIHLSEHSNYISREEAHANGFVNFTVVRHPIARFASSWYAMCILKPFRGVRAGISPDWTPHQLAQYLHEARDEDLDVHFKSMSAFIPERLDHEIQLESITTNWPFDIPCPWRILNASGKKDSVELTEDTKQIIAERYREDFERFGYQTTS